MNNIFKNAYFGKAYKTKDNTIVKFILQDKDFIILYIPKCKYSVETTHRYNSKGEFYLGDGEYGHGALDIVSEWTWHISDEELDKLANEYVGNYGCEDYDDGVEAYKAGCKAMEDYIKRRETATPPAH